MIITLNVNIEVSPEEIIKLLEAGIDVKEIVGDNVDESCEFAPVE